MYHSYNFHPQNEEDIIVKYVNASGRVGVLIQSKDDNIASVVNEKYLDFDDLGYIYWSDDQEVIVTNDEFFFSQQEIKRAVINTVANSFNQKGYSHPSVVWCLWNSPVATWICPPSKSDNFAQEKRKNEIKKKVNFLKVKKMCQALIDTFRQTAVRDVTFTGIDGVDHGYMIYDLTTATKCGVEVNCWGSSRWGGTCNCNNHPASFDIDPTEMTVGEIKRVENILSEENKSEKNNISIDYYYKKATVNGIEIIVGWDKRYGDYTIFFPQIEFSDASSERGVSDQVIRISEKEETANMVFELAVSLVNKFDGRDVYDLYNIVFEYLVKNVHGIPNR